MEKDVTDVDVVALGILPYIEEALTIEPAPTNKLNSTTKTKRTNVTDIPIMCNGFFS
ncbi:hypothetical protein DBT_0373 [Dissulfuribacter thermophilus]|uniref:Uncharacterized protein n=1 Tax=Dissulfuribacter thermophilus TaxID=1156395 RepID=A0A1B9F9F8_9BACT|nr:hypothetical protein DBT_0373 [Dissulfuribacter thermophilus]